MSNLSQIRRAEMLEYLHHLKEIHTDDESRIALGKIETALTEKKYGLVWEEHEEEVDKQLVHNIPVFKEIEDKKIVRDNTTDFNFLLEGDNLHSLKLLDKTHKGNIKDDIGLAGKSLEEEVIRLTDLVNLIKNDIELTKSMPPYTWSIYVEDETKKSERLSQLEKDLKSFDDAVRTQEEYINNLIRDGI